MHKLLPFALLLLLLSACTNLIPYSDAHPRVDPSTEARREQERKDAEQLRRSIPLTMVVRADCRGAKPDDPGEHWQWMGWRRGWVTLPNEIAVMCVTPDEYRKMFAGVEGAECHP